MNLSLLKGVALWMRGMHKILNFRRRDENLFLWVLQDAQVLKQRIYCDMTRSRSGMFVSDDEIGAKEFNAPFDVKLAEYTSGAEIKQVKVDGHNRILQVCCVQKDQYKQRVFWLILEFTGKHTNVILCDEGFVVIEALRHISQSKSWREVRVGRLLQPLPQLLSSSETESTLPQDVFLALREAYTQRYKAVCQSKKMQLLRVLELKRDALKKTLNALPKSDELIEDAKQYAKNGEVLFASLHLLSTHKILKPTLKLRDFDGKELVLEIPSCAMDLQDAGNWYFTQSKKLHKKAQHLYRQIENLQDKIEFLSDEIALLQQCESLSDILATQGKEQKVSKKLKGVESSSRYRDVECFFIDGFKIGIGRNAKDNQKLLEMARADDLWLHIKDVPSAHLIIFCGKKSPSQFVIEKSGEMLVRLYVARNGGGDFVVDYTKRRFVKPSQNAQVIYAKHKSLSYRI